MSVLKIYVCVVDITVIMRKKDYTHSPTYNKESMTIPPASYKHNWQRNI